MVEASPELITVLMFGAILVGILLGYPLAIVIAFLIFFLAGEAYIFTDPIPISTSTTYEIYPITEPMPAASVLVGSYFEGETLFINGTVFVDAGQRLEFRNSTLVFFGNADKDSSIWASIGSELILDSCTLRSSSESITYSFEIYGMARINDCEISGMWGDLEHENFDGGVEIYSSDVVITNTIIRDARTNGLMAVNSTVTISNCTFANADDDAMEIKHSVMRIDNCTITESGWAMVIDEGANVTLINSVVSENSHGIAVQDSSMILRNNTFSNNRNYAVDYEDMDYILMEGNTYSSNTVDIEGPSGNSYTILCNVITIMSAVFCILAILYSHKATNNT